MQRHRVLLVEDEPELAELLGELLTDFGHEVRIAGSMSEAERLLDGFSPCAVIADLTLPDVARSEVVARLRLRVGQTPIVLTSAIAASELRRTAEEQGAQGAVSKPFDLEELEQAVRFRCAEQEPEEAHPGA